MRLLRPTLALLACLLVLPAAAQPLDLGRADFPNSGAPEAQEPFMEGLLLLHSFEYADAAEAFQAAQAADPDFALAYWGEAMTHNHPIWDQQDRAAAQAILERLGETPEARLAAAPTEREKDYLRTLETLYFSEGSKAERDAAYAESMARLHDRYPDDLEAASFYALALLGTARGTRDIPTYMQAAAVVEEVFDANPEHPGAAHYLIHSYDDPVHAPLGLRPARVYARIAPSAAHALHMPSHIFVALGMWDDVVASNEDSWQAAEDRVARKDLGVDDRNFHALYWLLYGYLQQGREDDARRLLSIMEDDAEASGSRRTRAHHAYMRAAYAVDAQAEELARIAETPVDVSDMGGRMFALEQFARAYAALETGDRAAARAAYEALQEHLAAEDDPNTAAEIMKLELEALLVDDLDTALARAAEAAALEAEMPFAFGPPVPPLPAHELYGALLIEAGRYEAAMEKLEASLARTPGRTRTLHLLARAAAAAGDAETAQQAYDTIEANWHRADADVRAALGDVEALLGSAR